MTDLIRKSPEVKPPTIDQAMDRIKELCVGLIYMSDNDNEPQPFRLDQWKSPLNLLNFLESLSTRVGTQVRESEWEFFFSRSIPRDPRWEVLKKYLESVITDRCVFVVGGRRANIYAIGIFPETKSLIGINTPVVHT